MKRTPEPELMDEPQQAAAYAAEDWSEAHGKIARYFRERFPQFTDGRVLDLGCGTADVTIRFVNAFPGVTAIGVDGSEAMLGFGRRAVSEAGLDSRITLENRYLPDTELETLQFDAVICNSLLHHLRLLYVVAWQRMRQAGISVLLIDPFRPRDRNSALRMSTPKMPACVVAFHASLCAYTADEVQDQLSAAALSSFQVDVVDEFHFVGWGLATG
jgi:ubiquinone/menaquinone biosynthesis C-methylase UbiE